MISMFRKRSSEFSEVEDGTATVEAVLWFPIFILVFFLAFDTAMMFKAETDAIRVVQDANRLASIGRLATTADTEAYIENRLNKLSPNANATTTINAVGVIQTNVEIPASDVGQIGKFKAFRDLILTVSAEHLKEDF